MTRPIETLLHRAVDLGYTLVAYYDEPNDHDYVGEDPVAALQALDACDEMQMHFLSPEGKFSAWILYSSGLAPDEQIIDFIGSGAISQAIEEACRG